MVQQQLEASNSLFIESMVRWHIGDWEYLAEIGTEDIVQHPKKCQMAMFKAAALFQQGAVDIASIWANQAMGWGGDAKMLARIMLSGSHNSLGRCALLTGKAPQAQTHIKEAMRIGCMELDEVLLYPARLMQQKKQISASPKLGLPHTKEAQPTPKLTKEQLQAQQQQIKEKFDQAKQARTEKDYRLAEKLLSEILQINPSHLLALKERARNQAEQQRWMASVTEYDRLLQTQIEAENAILARSLMKKNADLLDEAIADLEHGKALGFYSTRIAHQLAIAYRDNQQWEQAESTVRELYNNDPEYLRNLPFATFVADLLRKRKKVKEAYGLLKVVVEQALTEGEEIPLNTKAILEELQRTVNLPEYVREVSNQYYDTIYAHSEKYQVDAEHSTYLPVWEKVVALLKQEGLLNILDVGCGPGQFAEYIIKQISQINYLGIDYSYKAIEAARSRCPTAQFHVKDLMQENIINNYNSDIILILEVLEHIENDLGLITEIPPGKKVIFSVPNVDSIGHVRFFMNESDVLGRYNRYFDSLRVDTIALGKRSKIYLSVGIRNIEMKEV